MRIMNKPMTGASCGPIKPGWLVKNGKMDSCILFVSQGICLHALSPAGMKVDNCCMQKKASIPALAAS